MGAIRAGERRHGIREILGLLARTDDALRLRGTSLHFAVVASALLVVATAVVAVAEHNSDAPWGLPLLQGWTLVPQALSALLLAYLAVIRTSGAFWRVAILLSLVALEEAFHVLNVFVTLTRQPVRWVADAVQINDDVVGGILTYGLVAVVGVAILASALLNGSIAERRVVRNLAALLLVGGFVAAVGSILAAVSDRSFVVYVEETGESVVFAVMAGYLIGLVRALRVPRPWGAPS